MLSRGLAAAVTSKSSDAPTAAAHAASPKAIFVGPAWHDLGLTPTAIRTIGRTGQCYLKEVRTGRGNLGSRSSGFAFNLH